MMKSYLLVLPLLLCMLLGKAQGIVHGVIVTKGNHERVPYATVFLADSTQRIMSNPDGAFHLNLPQNKAEIVVSLIGYRTISKTVQAGDSVTIELPMQCFQDYFYRRYVGLSLASGIKYTPLGGQLTLFQPYLWHNSLMQPAARLELGYQVGSHSNYRMATFSLDELVTSCNVNLDVALDYQRLLLREPSMNFERRSLGVNIIWGSKLPIWLAVGHTSLAQETDTRLRTGLELGSEYSLFSKGRYRIDITSRLAWWQSCWQWQSKASVDRERYIISATYQQIGRQYREIGLRLGVKLMVPKNR
jgi:hypothetical protein